MAERMTVAKLTVVVSKLDARLAELEKSALQGVKPLSAKVLDDLRERLATLETQGEPTIVRHTSRAVLSVDPALPEIGGMQQQFAHYRLPAGVKRGQVRIARITGQGSKGRGYANLRVDLNGDEGWGEAPLWLVVANAPFSRGNEPDTWRQGFEGPDGVKG